MIKHIVFFNFKDSAEGADKQANMAHGRAMLEALAGQVPTLRRMTAGPNAVPGATAWDFALVAEFDDVAGLRAYIDHPAHRAVSEFMSKVRRDRASVDFEF